jgi:hypothetical protein
MASAGPGRQIPRMKRLLLLTLALGACHSERNAENSAVCGITALAAGNMILDQFQGRTTVLHAAPPDLVGEVPARVIGRGSATALAARADSGVVLGYTGDGFPDRPGFAVALVDDSSEVFRGVLIFESDGPADYPQIGTISSAASTLPLYAMRVSWSHVNDPKCPLFTVRDTTPR